MDALSNNANHFSKKLGEVEISGARQSNRQSRSCVGRVKPGSVRCLRMLFFPPRNKLARQGTYIRLVTHLQFPCTDWKVG